LKQTSAAADRSRRAFQRSELVGLDIADLGSFIATVWSLRFADRRPTRKGREDGRLARTARDVIRYLQLSDGAGREAHRGKDFAAGFDRGRTSLSNPHVPGESARQRCKRIRGHEVAGHPVALDQALTFIQKQDESAASRPDAPRAKFLAGFQARQGTT